MTYKLIAYVAALAALATALAAPAPAVAQADGCAVAQPAPKKKGFGLGRLVAAAQRAGVTDLIAANLGDGAGAQMTGLVAGAAAASIESEMAGGSLGQVLMANAYGGATDGARAAQLAGAVTGMAMELGADQAAAAALKADPCASAPGGAAAQR